jgi:hypothetical protein
MAARDDQKVVRRRMACGREGYCVSSGRQAKEYISRKPYLYVDGTRSPPPPEFEFFQPLANPLLEGGVEL